MRLWDILRTRLRSLVFRDRRESELTEELQLHLERETERLQAGGLSPDAARLQALRTFGGVEQIKEECRDARGTAFVDNTVRDILYALRTFQRAPLVAFTIVSTVALGLGLVAVAFTILNALLFRVDAGAGRARDVRGGAAANLRRRAPAVSRARNSTRSGARPASSPTPTPRCPTSTAVVDGRRMSGTFVTGNFFQVLGVNAAMGRTLTPADDEPFAGRPVMVLSHRGWDRLFARDPAMLGRRVLVNGVTFEIVGVMPEGFRGLTVAPDDYWAPLSMLGQVRPIHRGREADVGRRHHRTPEAGPVARRRHGRDSPSGMRASRTAVRSSAARRTSRSCRGAAPSRSRSKRCS